TPAVDLPDAGDHAVGGEVAPLGLELRVHRVGQAAVLDEAARVEQRVDALAHRPLAGGALAADQLGAAHRVGPLAPAAQVLDQRLPVVQLGFVSHGSASWRQRPLSHWPFHTGDRFPANAAMPSRESSVIVVTVSIGCRYRRASSAARSTTA